jgi:hypothetical protein
MSHFGNTLQRNQKKVVYQVQQRTTQATDNNSGAALGSKKEISIKNFNEMKLHHPQTLNHTPRDQT